MNLENQSTLLEDIGVQSLMNGSYVSSADLVNDIDAITGDDAVKVSQSNRFNQFTLGLKIISPFSFFSFLLIIIIIIIIIMNTFIAPVSAVSDAHGAALQKNNQQAMKVAKHNKTNKLNKMLFYEDELLNCS